MKVKVSKTVEITSVDDWRTYAPPKNQKTQWKDGRSAKLLAQYVLSKNFASDMSRIIKSCGFNASSTLFCEPEFNTSLPCSGSGRNHDLLIDGRDFVIGVEAKVSEPFGNTIGKEYNDNSENKQNRVEKLLKYIDKSFDDAKDYKYQLLTGLVGTMLEAKKRKKNKCLFLVILFAGDVETSGNTLKGNEIDFNDFRSKLLGFPSHDDSKIYNIDGVEITCQLKKVEVNYRQDFFCYNSNN